MLFSTQGFRDKIEKLTGEKRPTFQRDIEKVPIYEWRKRKRNYLKVQVLKGSVVVVIILIFAGILCYVGLAHNRNRPVDNLVNNQSIFNPFATALPTICI